MKELVAHFDRLLADASTPTTIRRIEREADAQAPALARDELWSRIEDSGFLDSLVPESQGGAGLTLGQAFGLFEAEGRHALALPVGQTMFVRGVLALQGSALPSGCIAIAPQARLQDDSSLRCAAVPYAMVADWVVVATGGHWQVLSVADAQRQPSGIHGSLRADLHWAAGRQPLLQGASYRWFDGAAAITAAQLAGAIARVLDITVAFANQREQFGRPIGKFQAIQHQVAVMAEHVAAARMAAEIACSSPGLDVHPLRTAVGKARTSEAAAYVAPIAHAVHGAIGITAELDLQLYTRRIHEWRADYGSEQHWNGEIGKALLAAEHTALDFMREALLPANEELGG